MQDELKIFAENVAHLRRRHGLSKKDMAKLLGIGMCSLNKLEKGEFPPRLTVEVNMRIYLYFGIYPSDQFRKIQDT